MAVKMGATHTSRGWHWSRLRGRLVALKLFARETRNRRGREARRLPRRRGRDGGGRRPVAGRCIHLHAERGGG